MILPLLTATAKWVGIAVPPRPAARPEDFPEQMRRDFPHFHRLFSIHNPRQLAVSFTALERNAVIISRLSVAEVVGMSDDDLRQRGVTWPVEPAPGEPTATTAPPRWV